MRYDKCLGSMCDKPPEYLVTIALDTFEKIPMCKECAEAFRAQPNHLFAGWKQLKRREP